MPALPASDWSTVRIYVRVEQVRKSYIRNCAVHHSFNRGMTIHGVHGLRLYNNVIFQNLGHR
eukprot:4728160-Pyramimonas_sp.AAC.1